MFTISRGKNGTSSFKSFLFFSLLITSMIFLTPGCSEEDTPTNPVENNEVSIESNSFSPENKSIDFGKAVKWINNDGANHRVVSGDPGSPDGRFDSGTLRTGDEFSFTFDYRTGEFDYYCSLHTSVTGKVTVK